MNEKQLKVLDFLYQRLINVYKEHELYDYMTTMKEVIDEAQRVVTYEETTGQYTRPVPVGNYNKLSPAQTERLAILSEELGEAQQIIGKILRHGYYSYNPTIANPPTNKENLEKEIADVLVAIDMLIENDDIDDSVLSGHMDRKRKSIKMWLHHQ